MEYKIIACDLDGTLLDTMEDITNAVNHALKSCGCRTIGIEECRKLERMNTIDVISP